MTGRSPCGGCTRLKRWGTCSAKRAFVRPPRRAGLRGIAGRSRPSRSEPTSQDDGGPAVTTERTEVVVVGGGPAGALTAMLLARAGRAVVLLERAPRWRWRACGVFTSPASVAALR